MDQLTAFSEKPKPNRLDKYLDYLNPDMKGVALNTSQLERFELMRLCRHWRIEFFSPGQVVKLLEEKHEQKKSNAYQILKDADYIFGKTEKLDREAERGILYEYYHKALQAAWADTEASGVAKAMAVERIVDKMVKLSGAADGAVNVDIRKMMPTVNIIFTDEPAKKIENEPINIDYEPSKEQETD